MKPNGLVFAASTTSHTSIPIRSHISASSFTRPMLTARNVFSSSLTISATFVELTGTIVSIAAAYSAVAISTQSAVVPPTTLGVFFVVNFALDGSTRSGENARKKSSPTFSPVASNIGCSSSAVVPGYVVDSSTTSMPGCRYLAICSAAATTYDMSGSLVLRNGVGTQMLTVSSSLRTEKSVVASSMPA